MIKKYIEIFKYRIKRLIASKYTKGLNKMLNNVWKFCEPDFVNNDGSYKFADSSGKINISNVVKKRMILKNLSLNLYDPTPDKYPAKYIDNIVQNKMKILTNSTYGVQYEKI